LTETDAWLAARVPHWQDERWWNEQIDLATSDANPVLSNLRITLAHQELSLALHRITGADSGANFHTWAVWGSKKAGQTIRKEEMPGLPMPLAAALHVTGNRFVETAACHIFGGNVTVLSDIGRQTARFVCAFSDPAARSEERLEEFASQLRPGPTEAGGQDLLRGAYRHYFAAAAEADEDRRDELMLCANLLAILHEHRRLDPYIDASVPRPMRRVVTTHLLSFTVGAEAIKVSDDVPVHGVSPFPETLRTIELPELQSLLAGPDGWDRTPNSVDGSAAHDWTQISDRMNFIVDLFRTRQSDPNLFTAPYSPAQREMIYAGNVPAGPL
jgi:hypothetical protein